MRILLGYSYHPYAYCIKSWTEAWLARLRAHGIAVDGFCLTLNPPGNNLIWSEMDALWRRGDKELLTMYEGLARKAEGYDVFVNFNGVNVHPEFVLQLPTFNAYSCFDDPESSDNLSRPVAWAYDLSLVGNIAAVDAYRSWGVKEARFWPLGFRADDYDPALTHAQILSGERDVDVALTCERETPWRRARVDNFAAAFPQGAYYGKGWPNGFLPEERRVSLYQRTKIGINIHNSTGPINFRTYILPANGVMQVCDNKSHLGQVFALGKEVAGFDTIEEAIDLCRYYLTHADERRQVAAAGWERTLRDYNEVAIFKLMIKYVEQLRGPVQKSREDALIYLTRQRKRTTLARGLHLIRRSADKVTYPVRCASAAVRRRISLRSGPA
jgi:spore maturation protein CgeB